MTFYTADTLTLCLQLLPCLSPLTFLSPLILFPLKMEPTEYLAVIKQSLDSSLRLAAKWLPPPGLEQQDILLAGAALVLLPVLVLGAIFLYKRIKPRKQAVQDPATSATTTNIPKPKIKPENKPVSDQPKPWKKISGVKENLPQRPESKPEKIFGTKEKVAANTNKGTEEKLNVRKTTNTHTPSPSPKPSTTTGWKKEPNKVKFEKPELAGENGSQKMPEEPKRVPIKRIVRPEIDEEKEALKFAEELREAERKAEEEAKKQLRPIHLNIDSQARSKDEVERSSVREMDLIKKLCGEMREIAKTTNPEEREERQKEIDKVRSAR